MDIFSILIGISVGFCVALFLLVGKEKSKIGQTLINLVTIFHNYIDEKTVVHDWSKWEIFEEDDLTNCSGTKIGRCACIRRTCNTTGEVQMKLVET